MSTSFPTVREFLADPKRHEMSFFSRVSLPNGTFKTTHAHRLDDLNDAVLPLLYDLQPLRIMDVAASSGISTAEWRDHVVANGLDCSIVAGDLVDKVFLVRVLGMELLVDESGELLHIDAFGSGYPSRVKGIKQFVAVPIRGMAQIAYRFLPRRHVADVKIMEHSIASVKDDIASPNPPEFVKAFNVVRAANILNIGYFPANVLSTMVGNLKERLTENGLLIVCRTVPKQGNHGAAYRLTNGKFVECLRVGSGSEVDHIIRLA